MIKKDIIFYSNYCEYSKQLISLISKNNIQTYFHLISVDDPSITLPSSIDRVPMLINKNKSLFSGDDLFNYIVSIIKQILLNNINTY